MEQVAELAENLDDTSPTPVPTEIDLDEPIPLPPPAFRAPEADAPAAPPPPPPVSGTERSPSSGHGDPPQPPPPPRSPLVPRGVTQAAVAAAGGSVQNSVPEGVADAAGSAGLAAPGSLAARARNVAVPTPPPPARESFVDELRRAIGDDAPDAGDGADFFTGAEPSEGAEGLFEEGSDKARTWFGRRG